MAGMPQNFKMFFQSDAIDHQDRTWESHFRVAGNQSWQVRCLNNSDQHDPKYLRKCVKHPDYVMVWGCFLIMVVVKGKENTTNTKRHT